MATRSPLLNVMAMAAQKAARGLKRDFGEVQHLQVSQKGPGDFVSAADLKADQVLREELLRARPSYSILTEENGFIKGEDPEHCWIVDPLDGTSNFLHGLPHFAISIALERAGEIVAGLIYDPVKEETFTAEKGAGAQLNNRRIRVSARRSLHECLLAIGAPFRGHGDPDRFQKQIHRAIRETAGIRRWGAASLDLAYVAAGRFDAYWEEDLSSWDIAAGILIVHEAGGFISDLEGGQTMLKTGSILASNGHLHAPIQGFLRKI